MIACYAWTETQVVNMIQVLRTDFADDKADLFILKLDRITDRFVQAVTDLGFFSEVRVLYKDYEKCLPLPIPDKLKRIFKGSLLKKRFHEQLSDCTDRYEDIFIPGFWGESLFFLREVCKTKIPRIHFVEEGMYSYLKDSMLCRIDSVWKDRFERMFLFRLFYSQASGWIEDIRLYRPEEAKIAFPPQGKSIPPINKDDPFWREFADMDFPADVVREYKNRKYIILFGARKEGYESTFDRSMELVRSILCVLDPKDVILRLHPTNQLPDSFCEEMCSTGVYLDNSITWFEGLASIIDLKEKTVITRNSSILLNLFRMGDLPGDIIMTYKLYPYYLQHGDRYREDLAEKLTGSASLFIPSAEQELTDYLSENNHASL